MSTIGSRRKQMSPRLAPMESILLAASVQSGTTVPAKRCS